MKAEKVEFLAGGQHTQETFTSAHPSTLNAVQSIIDHANQASFEQVSLCSVLVSSLLNGEVGVWWHRTNSP